MESNKPLISVIIPVYNVQEFVEQCLRSVMTQTYSNLEIIVVDDGSTDNSGSICDRIAGQDSRIRLIHKANGGLSDARNVGIEKATGEFIAFVDSDDWIEPDMYDFLYDNLVKHNADISVCTHYIDKGSKRKCKRLIDHPIICDRDKAMQMLMTDKILHNYAWDKLYRRSLFGEDRYPVGRLYEDIAFTYKVMYRANCVVIHNLPKYHYRVRPGSIVSARYQVRRNYEYFCSEHELMTFMVENGYVDGARHLVRRGIHTLKRLILSNASDDMLREILEKLKPYHYVGAREVSLANVWRRWMMENHLQAYKSLYILSKKLLGKAPK